MAIECERHSRTPAMPLRFFIGVLIGLTIVALVLGLV